MLRTKMESMFCAVDQMMNDMFKASGIDILDAIGGMDDETAAMVIPACKMYTEAKELSLETADMMDEQKLRMEQLLKMNEELIKQTMNLREEQRLLINKIEKMEQAHTCKCSKTDADKEKK